ncbi:lymphatic vessel endothelial hyaluronic acid receptor 1a [Notolabrus celidotus]|uniref:lymphatic vessel endothelial hyaluronic acid receptor 1a n=1 Tax=Notolabrus celidotus TaxID=1203425 RepID=UPI00148F723D|nr:lymphatic vessel endothelial hyaluronic acid receptor 1a [Notolabrus celidotus]
MIWFCITLLLSITQVMSLQTNVKDHIRVFPGANQTIAGVFQATSINNNKPKYAFNASEARQLCLSLGVTMASKAEVQTALSRGLETCRFGWIDEHFAVIPRSRALPSCGQSQTGLVTWRADVTHKFDVFCFNESDAAIQLKDTTTDSPQSTSKKASSTHTPQYTSSTSPSFFLENLDSEGELVRFVGKAQGSSGGKAILITTTCALLLIAVILFAYFTLQRNYPELKQQQQHQQQQEEEYIETEEWTCVKVIQEPETDSQEEKSLEEDDDTS